MMAMAASQAAKDGGLDANGKPRHWLGCPFHGKPPEWSFLEEFKSPRRKRLDAKKASEASTPVVSVEGSLSARAARGADQMDILKQRSPDITIGGSGPEISPRLSDALRQSWQANPDPEGTETTASDAASTAGDEASGPPPTKKIVDPPWTPTQPPTPAPPLSARGPGSRGSSRSSSRSKQKSSCALDRSLSFASPLESTPLPAGDLPTWGSAARADLPPVGAQRSVFSSVMPIQQAPREQPPLSARPPLAPPRQSASQRPGASDVAAAKSRTAELLARSRNLRAQIE